MTLDLGDGKARKFNADMRPPGYHRLQLSSATKPKRIYKSILQRQKETVASLNHHQDQFNAPIKVGSQVVWVYNQPISGGSRPYLAFGMVEKLMPKTVQVRVAFMRNYPEKVGDVARAALNSVFVLDENILDRLLAAKIST